MAELYAGVRDSAPDRAAQCAWFRRERDRLFHAWAASPIPESSRSTWRRRLVPHDPAARLEAAIVPRPIDDVRDRAGARRFALQPRGRGAFHARRPARFALYWLEGYGGGLWLPFTDGTSGRATYGGGRYLHDTIKGADLGVDEHVIVLDFNYAYNPSCAYDERWSPASRRREQARLARPGAAQAAFIFALLDRQIRPN